MHALTRTNGGEETPLWSLVLVCAAAVLLTSAPNLLDPIVRHDDFPALTANPDGYYSKTLEEGRWISYLWHLRGFVTPHWLNFSVYQILWATYAATLAVAVLGRDAHPKHIVGLGILVAVAPPATMISLWFNTLMPGMFFVAMFGVLACYLSPKHLRYSLLVFVPLTLMSYTTYPLLLLAICLAHKETERTFVELVKIVGTFVISFALGMIAIYSLNYWEHGVFGVVMAEWREPTNASDLASMWANAPVLLDTAKVFFRHISFNIDVINYFLAAALTGATLIMLRKDRMMTLFLYTGAGVGLALIILQCLKTGVVVSSRGMIFVWAFFALLLVLATRAAVEEPRHGRLMRNATVLTTVGFMMLTGMTYTVFRDWQRDTRIMAADINSLEGPIHISGDYRALASHSDAGIQHLRGLYARLNYLTGRDIYLCDSIPENCPDIPKEDEGGSPVRIYDTAEGPLIVLDYVEVAEAGESN